MTGLISQIAASAVPPSMMPKVDKASALNLKQENHIRAYIRGMTQSRIIDRDAGRRMKYKIYFFRITKMVEEKDNPLTGGKIRKFEGVMQSNKAEPNEPPQFQDYKDTTRIYDFWNAIPKRDREGLYQCFWFSEANCWLPIPTCEDEESSSDPCILLPCSNFWGIKTGEGYNVYDHSGTFIDIIENALSWTECEILDGDVVAIDTDENCTPKVTPDPCAMLKRLCGESSSSPPESSTIAEGTCEDCFEPLEGSGLQVFFAAPAISTWAPNPIGYYNDIQGGAVSTVMPSGWYTPDFEITPGNWPSSEKRMQMQSNLTKSQRFIQGTKSVGTIIDRRTNQPTGKQISWGYFLNAFDIRCVANFGDEFDGGVEIQDIRIGLYVSAEYATGNEPSMELWNGPYYTDYYYWSNFNTGVNYWNIRENGCDYDFTVQSNFAGGFISTWDTMGGITLNLTKRN